MSNSQAGPKPAQAASQSSQSAGTWLLEPLFLAVMAAGVTTIILAVMLPLYSILTQM